MQTIINFIKELISNRSILFGLARNDFKAKFAKSFLGIFWAFMQPLVTLLVMWFAFQVGFRNLPVSNIPFIVWLTPAYLSWAFFSEAVVSETNSLTEYKYLLKQVNFRASIIPLVKIISSSFVHVVFFAFILFIMLIYSVPLSIYNLQVLYYFGCMVILLTGLGWLLSAVSVFVADVGNIVNVVIQIGFWATPICWSDERVEGILKFILQLNPMYYICQGYRDSFINHVWFWEKPLSLVIFWGVTGVVFIIGVKVFRKLRPYFVDAL